MRKIVVFSGSAHRELAGALCRHLGVPLSPSRHVRFANDCLGVQLQANCRERDARGASAGRITVVTAHVAYARSDKKNAPRVSIAAKLVDHLHVLHELAVHFRRLDLRHGVVVSPDVGNAKEAARFARLLDVPVAAGTKERPADDEVVISEIVGDAAEMCTDTVPVPGRTDRRQDRARC